MEYHDWMAIRLSRIRSVTEFQRNPKGLLLELKKSSNPVVLTVNGKAEFVVQDADSYQQLLDKVSAAEDLEAIRAGLVQSLSELGRPAAEFFNDFEKAHGL